VKAARISSGALLIWLLASCPASSQEKDKWIRLTSDHFEMYSAADQKKSAATLEYFERVRDFFLTASPVRPPGDFPVRIVAFKDPDEMRMFSPNPLAAAYFAPGPVRDTIVMKNPSDDNYPIAVHEYMHLVMRHSGLRIPLWLNEGWADVYSTLKPVSDGVAVGDLISRYMPLLDSAQWFTIEQLQGVTTESREYNEAARTGMFYAESWALTHMLFLSPDYKAGFPRFVSALSRNSPLTDALKMAFDKAPSQVLLDLQGYLARKKLYGTVFLVPMKKDAENPKVETPAPYDIDLMQADLQFASSHHAAAAQSYSQLKEEDPTRPEAYAGAGYMALQAGDKTRARAEFRKAFELGTDDAQLCMQLGVLDREAKMPAVTVMNELDRAVRLRPNFSEAIFQLALMKMDARDFEQALYLLGRVGLVPPERMTIYRSARAYANLQRGNIPEARQDAEAAQRAARTTSEHEAAERLLKLIEARAKGPAAAHPGEQLILAEGTAVGLRCAAAGSTDMSKMGIVVDGKQVLFDLPDSAAVEITKFPNSKADLRCGALPPFHLRVEYTPAGVTNRLTAGIIRRLEF
jgi:tetratricopeptide (TPR) repeat protein